MDPSDNSDEIAELRRQLSQRDQQIRVLKSENDTLKTEKRIAEHNLRKLKKEMREQNKGSNPRPDPARQQRDMEEQMMHMLVNSAMMQRESE